MNLPKQAKEINEDRQAIAPYNFVELPEEMISFRVEDLPDQDSFLSNRYTGEIQCELITASPLYIRGGVSPDDFANDKDAKDQPEFFNWNMPNTPLIPGSSLRGMLRAMVEIVSFGKINAVTNESLVYRSVGGEPNSHGNLYRSKLVQEIDANKFIPLIRAGYMHHDAHWNWYIQPSQKIKDATWAQIQHIDIPRNLKPWKTCKNASEIFVEVGQAEMQPVRNVFSKFAKVTIASSQMQSGLMQAVLAYSGRITGKKSEVVVYPEDPTQPKLPLDDDLIRRYRDQLTPAQRELLGENGVLVEGQPVFYLPEAQNPRQVFFFGHCRMLRLPYPHTPIDMVPTFLRDEQTLDLAESLFGYTKAKGEGKNRAYASRVNVSDAQLFPGQTDIWLNTSQPTQLKILSGPKPTTFQHYLVQTTPNSRVYKYTKNGQAKETVDLADYASQTPLVTVIRGHKLYWHKNEHVTEADIAESSHPIPGDTQHTKAYPIRSGVHFLFSIRFENLSDIELGGLLWVVTLTDAEKICFKLGMGKPLGMGSVKIHPTLSLQNREKRYSRLFDEKKWFAGQCESNVDFISIFERFMENALSLQGSFKSQTRIQTLLEMLKFPGPTTSLTEYQLFPGAFRRRPVLPSPSGVIGKNQSGKTENRNASNIDPKREISQTFSQSSPTKTTQSAGNKLSVGDIVTAIIYDDTDPKGDLVVTIDGYSPDIYICTIKKADTLGKKYQEGNSIRCEVLSIKQDRKEILVSLKVSPRKK